MHRVRTRAGDGGTWGESTRGTDAGATGCAFESGSARILFVAWTVTTCVRFERAAPGKALPVDRREVKPGVTPLTLALEPLLVPREASPARGIGRFFPHASDDTRVTPRR